MARLAVIHISDIHIGATIRGGGFVPHSNGHDHGALEAFCQAREDLVADDGNRILVVSGDVSAHGSETELGMYRVFRDHVVPVDGVFQHRPFAHRFDSVLDIPGNHDLWHGAWLHWLPTWRVDLGIRERYFPGSWGAEIPLDRHLVCVHGLCSTSGAAGGQQFWAVGGIRRQDLETLDGAIQAAERTATRAGLRPFHILVTHHTPSDGTTAMKGIDAESQARLEELCAARGVRGMLTGHAHSRRIEPPGALPVEVRCGTTLQADAFMTPQEKSFYEHELIETGDAIEWKVTPWIYHDDPYLRGYGFERIDALTRTLVTASSAAA
jgi:3',5'-cyclic AMP phosphodiesterase CpdA